MNTAPNDPCPMISNSWRSSYRNPGRSIVGDFFREKHGSLNDIVVTRVWWSFRDSETRCNFAITHHTWKKICCHQRVCRKRGKDGRQRQQRDTAELRRRSHQETAKRPTGIESLSSSRVWSSTGAHAGPSSQTVKTGPWAGAGDGLYVAGFVEAVPEPTAVTDDSEPDQIRVALVTARPRPTGERNPQQQGVRALEWTEQELRAMQMPDPDIPLLVGWEESSKPRPGWPSVSRDCCAVKAYWSQMDRLECCWTASCTGGGSPTQETRRGGSWSSQVVRKMHDVSVRYIMLSRPLQTPACLRSDSL